MKVVFETWLQNDLKKPVKVKQLTGNIFSADREGNLVGVEVFDDGAPAALTGGVTGFVIRSDGATVYVSGTLSGNKASIVLPATCYVCVGQISIVIKVGYTTVGACVGYVYRSTTDTIVDPGHEIPSLEELLAEISEIQQLSDTIVEAERNRVSAESGRVSAENSRVSAEESRASAETARAAAEAVRASAESDRAAAETARATAESARATAETGRASAESNRVDAEAARSTAETARQTAESGRVTAENARESAESTRQTTENNRISAETSRASAETARASAESDRAQAELQRAAAETSRAGAETSRANAENARDTAEGQRAAAETARGTAETARATAETARDTAETARETAEGARQTAETARASAETARANAESSRVSAETARATAETARSSAETARAAAETQRETDFATAKTAAENATSAANTAAGKIENMTVAASGLAEGASPTVAISEVDGHKHVSFGIPKGDTGATGAKGKDFHIQKTFASIAAMQAYDPEEDQSASKMSANDFCMIDTGSVEDADTGKLYCYEPENSPVWRYIGDLSGKQGIKGETGTGIANIVLNNDYTLTITMDDGVTSYTTSSIRGATGATGNGIASVILQPDYGLKIEFTDGTSVITSSIRGETGATGATGNGIASVILNNDYTLTIEFTDGSSVTTSSIRGATGETGATGTGIQSVILNNDYTLTVELDNGTSYTTSSIRGATGETGNGIQSVILQPDYGLKIEFTDGTSTVTSSIRGAKGETGATPDISIGTITTLNAGQQATASMTGTAEAPVLNLGIPKGYDATITSQTEYYQTSSSGTTVPSGTWSTTVPTVTKGEYLWVKHHVVWYDNTETDIYAVAYQGMDGMGTVTGAVMGSLSLQPDTNGVITIPVDQVPTENSNNLVTSGRIYTEIDALNDRIDNLDPEAPSPIFTDVNFSLATTDWTLSNGVYTADIANSTLLTATAGVQIFYNSTFRTALAGDIYVNKTTGHVTLTTTAAPVGTLTGFIRIIDSMSGLVPVHRGGTGAATPKQARQNLNVSIRSIPVNFGTVSSLPQTVYDADITADMVPEDWIFGNPAACPQGIKCTTAAGSVTISVPSGGTFSGETTVSFRLKNPRTSVEGSEAAQETQRVPDFVQVNEQTLTTAQKTQARANIGAADGSVIGTVPSGSTLQGQVDALNSNLTQKEPSLVFEFKTVELSTTTYLGYYYADFAPTNDINKWISAVILQSTSNSFATVTKAGSILRVWGSNSGATVQVLLTFTSHAIST